MGTRWLTIPEAARVAGVSRRTMLRRLLALQEAHPDRCILRRRPRREKQAGWATISLSVLREVLDEGQAVEGRSDLEEALERIDDRLTALRSRVSRIARHVGFIENGTGRDKTGHG